MLAGCLGALLTLLVTFAPCFLWIFLGTPYVEALRGNRALGAALSAITAAVVGVILNLALWFAIHVVSRQMVSVDWHGIGPHLPVLSSVDWRAAALSAMALLAMFRLRLGMLSTLVVCGLAGMALAALG